MPRDDAAGLIAALGLLALLLLGLVLIVRGLFTDLAGSARSLTPAVGFGRGVLGRTVMSLLSFAVAYKFFLEGYAGRLYGYEAMLGMAVLALLAMVLVPAVETLVAVTALTVFLMENTAVFGRAALGTFVGLLVVYALLRWLLGR
jgi:hypothetical protein